MRKTYLWLICLGLCFSGINCSKSSYDGVIPVITKITETQAAISWTSQKPYRGKVFYQPAGSTAPPKEAEEPPGESTHHLVTVGGLLPGTLYSYRVGQNGRAYQFRTQPGANKPFSFIMLYGDVSGKTLENLGLEVFDFLIDLAPPSTTPTRYPEQFAALRTTVPLFDLAGPAPWAGGNKDRSPDQNWKLDWGGLRLIFIDDIDSLPDLLTSPAAHTFGIVASPALVESLQKGQTIDEESLRTGKLHPVLAAHNRAHPTAPAAFVWLPGAEEIFVQLDEIRYVAIPVSASGGGAVRVDVDLENVRAVFPGQQKEEIVLQMPPLQGRRTCLECRRLADKGAYKESIAAYRDFIAHNRGHYQIDDAYFAIGEIYDEKLFLFKEAKAWYDRLIDEYPSGSLTPLAKQRLKYLARFGEENYDPLQRFERIRKVEYARQRGQKAERQALLEKVAAIIRDHPDGPVAPLMQHWLAGSLQEFSVDKAVAAYKYLKEKYPNSDEAREVAIEIGSVYYEAGLNKKALQAYRQALVELPHQKETVVSQIDRLRRNIRRDELAVVSWAILLILSATMVLPRPRAFHLGRIGRSLFLFVILLVSFSFAAYMIHEQLPSTGSAAAFVVLFALNASLSSFLSTHFAAKTFQPGRNRFLKALTGSLMGILFFATGFYLTVYHVNVHFLVLFKL